jgi:cytochrome b subunit of formate dehydrogenase
MATKKQQENSLQLAAVKQMLTLATSGFGLVAALAWNSAIQELVEVYIKPFLPEGSGLVSLLIYAIFVTLIAVIVTFNLSKVIEKLER